MFVSYYYSFFFFKQKTAYEMRISDWSSDVCSSDLYIDGFNRADPAGVAALYADDATVEDPVGSPLKTGKAEITKFYEFSMKTGAKLQPAAPISGSHGNSAAIAFDVELKMPEGAARTSVLDGMTFKDAGQITDQ